jgi:hypothetical protein
MFVDRKLLIELNIRDLNLSPFLPSFLLHPPSNRHQLYVVQSLQSPKDEILVAFFSKDLKSSHVVERNLVSAVASQDPLAVEAALAGTEPGDVRRLVGPGGFTLLHMACADKTLYATAHTALSLMMGGFYHQQRLWGTQVGVLVLLFLQLMNATAHTALSLMMGGFYHQQRL